MKFRLVDKITSWSPWQSINGIKAVSLEEYSLKQPFAEEPRLPEMLMLESFLQLGNWLVILSSDFQQMGMVARLSDVRFHGCLSPGERLQLAVRMVRRREDGFELAGEGTSRGRGIISGSGCVASVVPLADYQCPADLRVLFEEIYEPGSVGAAPAEVTGSPGGDCRAAPMAGSQPGSRRE